MIDKDLTMRTQTSVLTSTHGRHRKERLIIQQMIGLPPDRAWEKQGLRLQQTKGVNSDEKSRPSDAASS